MNMNTPILKRLLAAMLCSVFACGVQAQANAVTIAHADTSHFSPNRADGWQLLNSYIAPLGKDSAQIELILQHPNNINWSQLQLVGAIKSSSLEPSGAVDGAFFILDNQYQLKIAPTGKCYLKLLNGGAPADSLAVIPLRVIYKL